VRNMRRLRRQGWIVVRLWEHQVRRSPEQCLRRVLSALRLRHCAGHSRQPPVCS
jgi:DNA mismatch endonuclease (patch repair protein)